MIADDVQMNREVVHAMLKRIGLMSDVAENGQIAVAMANATAYSLILMDIRMPVMDGYSASAMIRTLPGYATTPIVALTADVFAEDRQRCLDSGMNDFLGKPVKPDTLRDVVSKWLGNSADFKLT